MSLILSSLQQRLWPGCGPWTGWGGGTMLFMALFWALLIAVAVGLVWRLLGPGRPSGNVGSNETKAEALVKERYARGEIDRDTYARMLEDLQRRPGG